MYLEFTHCQHLSTNSAHQDQSGGNISIYVKPNGKCDKDPNTKIMEVCVQNLQHALEWVLVTFDVRQMSLES